MDLPNSESSLEVCSEGERYFGESCKTPMPSSPDTCVTSTISCVSGVGEQILLGDYEMDCCQDLPQLTLALIKPDGMKYLHEIEKRIRHDGFTIVQSRRVHLSPEQASNFYHEHYGRPFFPLLVTSMSEGPVQVYILRRKDAVAMWKKMCGPPCTYEAKKVWPESLRAIYGTKGFKNVCHASASEEKAKEEIRFFFPNIALDNNFKCNCEVEDYIKEWVNPTLLEGLTQLCKNKPLDPLLWLGSWLLKNNPYKPKMKTSVALVPT